MNLGALASGALLLVPLTLAAQQDRWSREVDQRLARSAETLTPSGYRRTGATIAGTLFVDESREVDLPLAAAGEYLLLGGCDADCTGLELVISNASHYQVDAGRGPGVTPVVRIAPRPGERYRLTITLTGCRVSPCRYGVGIFSRKETAHHR